MLVNYPRTSCCFLKEEKDRFCTYSSRYFRYFIQAWPRLICEVLKVDRYMYLKENALISDGIFLYIDVTELIISWLGILSIQASRMLNL